MTYRIEGLAPEPFQPLFELCESELAGRRMMKVVAGGPGFPCRISLAEACEGETLLLLNHVSQPAPTPYRAAHAIFVRKDVSAAIHVDSVPDVLDRRTISLRGFDCGGRLIDARIAFPGEADCGIRTLFDHPEIAEIHAHNAAFGCFLARIERR